ncbi:HEPN domain-containing protein [Hanamia caeni]|jgi:HEPN domain-containing protein|uniref:HEPN domain-containing protein n=1 Tax=Hanamia caeni TaxID=2294116 RepID=A0A3M9NEC2_9BACT|nr:HEPN domain-containing protein [Hanamia caeni]RNI36134.1 HEPN domain-containing protein [Hanamia caeni]
MKDDERNYVEQWLEKAANDLLAARLILDHQPIILDISCFHCQQAVEKYLKTFLIFHKKDFPKTHNIDLLLKNCSTINDRFKEVDVKNLEDFAVRGRYPHDFLLPSVEEAEEFYQITLEIKELVIMEIKGRS